MFIASRPPLGAALGLALGLAAAASSPAVNAQTNLKIPHNSDEIREFVAEPAGQPCTTCGIVVSVRTETAPAGGGKTSLNLASNPTLTGGPGGQLATVPIGPKREGAAGPEMITVITVRYDSGSYARVEQHDETPLKKGDRVRVTDGRVELHQR